MEEKTELQKKAVWLVAEQIIAMLENNLIGDNGTETFKGWCKDGDVFHNNPELNDEEKKAATALMNEVAPKVDELTFNHLNYGY